MTTQHSRSSLRREFLKFTGTGLAIVRISIGRLAWSIPDFENLVYVIMKTQVPVIPVQSDVQTNPFVLEKPGMIGGDLLILCNNRQKDMWMYNVAQDLRLHAGDALGGVAIGLIDIPKPMFAPTHTGIVNYGFSDYDAWAREHCDRYIPKKSS